MAVSCSYNKTPKKKYSLSPGHILVHSKWKGTSLFREINVLFQGVSTEELDVDFYCYPIVPVIYVSEAELASGLDYEEKIKKLSEDSKDLTIIVDRNTTTIQQFSKLQDLVVLKLCLCLIPIGNIVELPNMLSVLCFSNSTRTPDNCFKNKTLRKNDDQLLNILSVVPGLGKQKAQKLVDRFGTLEKILFSSSDQIVSVIGADSAKKFDNFFHDRVQ